MKIAAAAFGKGRGCRESRGFSKLNSKRGIRIGGFGLISRVIENKMFEGVSFFFHGVAGNLN